MYIVRKSGVTAEALQAGWDIKLVARSERKEAALAAGSFHRVGKYEGERDRISWTKRVAVLGRLLQLARIR